MDLEMCSVKPVISAIKWNNLETTSTAEQLIDLHKKACFKQQSMHRQKNRLKISKERQPDNHEH